MADGMNFLEEAQFNAKGKLGRELTPSEMGVEFARWGLDDRVEYLRSIESQKRSGEPLSIREAARQNAYERALRDTHEALRKAGR